MRKLHLLLTLVLSLILMVSFGQKQLSDFSQSDFEKDRLPAMENQLGKQTKQPEKIIHSGKLIETTAVVSGQSKGTKGGGIVLDESFEGDWPPEGWTVINNGPQSEWKQDGQNGSPYGTACAWHGSWFSEGISDNWLISKRVKIDGDNYKIYFKGMMSLAEGDQPELRVSTGSSNPADSAFSLLSALPRQEESWYGLYSYDLSAYNGDSVYFAFYAGVSHSIRIEDVVVAPTTFTDAALTRITSPRGYEQESGLRDVVIRFENKGTTTISDFQIVLYINDEKMGTVTSEGSGLSIKAGEIYDLGIGEYDFSEAMNYDIRAELFMDGDVEPANDIAYGEFSVGNKNDLAIVQVMPYGSFEYEGEQLIKAEICNNGTATIDSIKINWQVNDTLKGITSYKDLNLAPGSNTMIDVTLFDFKKGVNTISVDIPYKYDINTADNSMSSTLAVDGFFEDFQGPLFPPAYWDADNAYLSTQDPLHWDPNNFYITSEGTNTVRSPLMHIEEGDYVTYHTAYGGSLYIMNGVTGDTILLQSGGGVYNRWANPTIDLSPFVGNHYLVWNLSGAGRLDEIYSSATIATFDNDLAAYRSNIEDIEHVVPVNKELNYTLYVQNLSTDTILGDAYSVELRTIFNDTDQLLKTVSGTTVNPNEIIDVTIPHSFENWDDETLYMHIAYKNDSNLVNNSSKKTKVIKVPENTNHVKIGKDQGIWSLNYPWNYGYLFTEDEVDLNQTIYYKDELEKAGYIHGVRYFTDNLGEGATNVKIWIGETERTNVDSGYFDPSNFTVVYDSLVYVNSYGRNGSIFIQFKEPYYYSGVKNLVIQHTSQNDSIGNMGNGFLFAQNTEEKRTIFNIGLTNYDPENLPILYNQHNAHPLIDFIVDQIPGQGRFAGRVVDVNGIGISDVEVSIKNTMISATTNQDGYYKMPYMLYDKYVLVADAFGYEYAYDTITMDAEDVTVDFELSERTEINLSGTVVGSDNTELGLENVNMVLKGYTDYNTTTNSSGSITLNNVYGNALYTVTLSITGYHNYVIDSLELEGINYDFGTIVMQEQFLNPLSVLTNSTETEVSIEWVNPTKRKAEYLQVDAGIDKYGFANEPFENVWLGNKFENNTELTLDSVEVVWTYDNGGTDGEQATVEIFDAEGNLLVVSDKFEVPYYETVVVDIPNVTVTGDYYVMVHWQDNEYSTHRIAFDYEWQDGTGLPMDDVAYIKYPFEDIVLFSEFLGVDPGLHYAFMVRAIGASENADKNSKSALSYNVYRGLMEEHSLVDSWTALNNEPISGLSYLDEGITSQTEGNYTYAVEAVYTEGSSDVTFSPILYHAGLVAPINLTAQEVDDKIIISWEAPSKLIESYNFYLDDWGTPHTQTTDTSVEVTDLLAGTYFIGVSANYATGTSDITEGQFVTDGVGGISVENDMSSVISVYPNPIKNKVSITNAEGGSVRIYNMVGELVKTELISSSLSTIDVSDFEQGIYIFQIQNSFSTYSYKLSKE